MSAARAVRPHWPHFVRLSTIMGGAIGGFAIGNFNVFLNVFIPPGTARRKLAREAIRAYSMPMGTQERCEASHIFPKARTESAPFRATVVAGLEVFTDKPVLLRWGEKDIAFSEKERSRDATNFPTAKSIALSGAGHYVQESRLTRSPPSSHGCPWTRRRRHDLA